MDKEIKIAKETALQIGTIPFELHLLQTDFEEMTHSHQDALGLHFTSSLLYVCSAAACWAMMDSNNLLLSTQTRCCTNVCLWSLLKIKAPFILEGYLTRDSAEQFKVI